MEVPKISVGAPRFRCTMVSGGVDGQDGEIVFNETCPGFLFTEGGEESTVMFPSYSALSYYGAEQETEQSEMIFFLVYAKKKRGFRTGKDSQKFAFQLSPDLSKESVIIFSRRLLIAADTAVLKFQQSTGTNDGKKKWSNVLSPRRKGADSPKAPSSPSGKGKEESDAPVPAEKPVVAEGAEDVYGADEESDGKADAKSDAGSATSEDFTLIYEEDAMRRRDLLSSAVQTIDGLRFLGNWVTNRKMFKSLIASQDEEPALICVTRRGLCMLKPVDFILSAYHWSEIRSFGCAQLPSSEPMDAFVWMHKSVTYTVLLTVAEEMETCCNNIINQALGGTFASRPIPKYYPPHPYNPEKDSDGGIAGQMLAAKADNKPAKWAAQQERGESWNKKHRHFLDAVIANDLHTVMETVKDRERHQLDIDYVDVNGISALYWGAIMGHAQMVAFLLPAGANVHQRDLTGGTPLHAAAYQGNQAIVSMLIKGGADPNTRNNAEQTPLHRASVSGLSGGVVVCVGLVESGCDVTAKDSRGNTALHLAALQGDASAVEALVQSEKGREVINEKNGSGRTPLHYAVLSGRKNCVEALLIVGADRFVKDGSGASAVDVAQREVADKEEREARAIAKGLVQTEGLQPARDTLQLLLHWDPNKAGRLFKMKMMSTNDMSAQNRRSMGSGKMTDLKAAMANASSAESGPPREASPAKAAKLNMLKKISRADLTPARGLGLDAEAIKEENKTNNELTEQSGAVSDSLKDWELKAKALKDRIDERARAEQLDNEAKAKLEAEVAAQAAIEAAEAKTKKDVEEAEAKAKEDAEAAATAARIAEEEAEAARLRLTDDVRWTDSPALGRRRPPVEDKKKKNAESSDEELGDDGVRVWEAPSLADEALAAKKKSGIMPHAGLLNQRRGSRILGDDEKDQFNRSLQSMVNLKNEKAQAAEGPKMDVSSALETPEEQAARLAAQHEAEERVEKLRQQLHEERRQRNIQRHLDDADRFESQGKFRDAIDEYRLALAEGPSELAEKRIAQLESDLKSEVSRTMDALAEIEQAASIATEMSVGFSKLAGNLETDKKKYGAAVVAQREGMTTEEFLRSLAERNTAEAEEGFDDAEFQATLEQSKVDTRVVKPPTVTTATVKKKQSGEKLQINVDVASKTPTRTVDTSDTWIAPLQQKKETKTVQKSEEEDDEEEKQRVAQEKKRLEEERKAREEKMALEEEKKVHDDKKKAEEEQKKKRKEEKKQKKRKEEEAKKAAEEQEKQKAADAAKKAEEERKKAAEKPAAAASAPPATTATTIAPAAAAGEEETFDKKTYNAHVRKAKQFAAENNHQKALDEYLAASAVRPGHEGLEKKIKSLRKKIAAAK